MKIIQANVVADRGSTGKICQCIDRALTVSGHQSLLCYGRKGTAVTERRFKFGREWEAAASKVANLLGRLMYASSPLSTRRLIEKIKDERPDIVHLHCINGYCVDIYRLLHFLAAEKISTVVTHHGEFYYTGSCGHALDCRQFMQADGCRKCPAQRDATGAIFIDLSQTAWLRMRNAFSRFDSGKLVFTAVSPWVKDRSMLSPIVNGYDCHVVENGLDTSIFHASDNRAEGRRFVPGCRGKMVLHVTASFSDSPAAFKGGSTVLEVARLMPDVTFVIAASYSKVSGTLPSNVYLHGRTKDQQELAALYNAADTTIITSLRETFSMVVAESLCCGTPVVGFQAGGPESIAIKPYSDFIDRKEGISGLHSALSNMLNRDFDHLEISRQACAKFSTDAMAGKYISVYRSLLETRL